MPNRVTNFADHLLANVLLYVAKPKHQLVIDLFTQFKIEFPDKEVPSRRGPWSEDRKYKASARWQAKHAQEKFYIRKGGVVREMLNITAVAEDLNIRESTLRCYLSLGRGTAKVKNVTVSKEPLEAMSAADAWAQDFYIKNKCWPNFSDNPHNESTRRY